MCASQFRPPSPGKRRGLPDSLPFWNPRPKKDSWLRGGQHVTMVVNPDTYSEIREAIMEGSSQRQVLDWVGESLGVDGEDVCLLQRIVVSRDGEKTESVFFHTTFNRSFNDWLKEGLGGGAFHQYKKLWHRPVADNEWPAVLKGLEERFRLIVDIDEQAVAFNPDLPPDFQNDYVAFRETPYWNEVSLTHVQHALSSAMRVTGDEPNVKVGQVEPPRIHNGKRFVDFPKTDRVWTRLPFLLFDYRLPDDSQPYYFALSTLSGAITDHEAGGRGKNRGAQLVARFMDASRRSNASAAFVKKAAEPLSSRETRAQVQGGFEARFPGAMRSIERWLPDCQLLPCASDLVAILDPLEQARTEPSDAVSFVHLTESEAAQSTHVQNLAEYFGVRRARVDHAGAPASEPPKSDRLLLPVFFKRHEIESLDEDEFLREAIHGIAHHFHQWFATDFNLPSSVRETHDKTWVILDGILGYLLLRDRMTWAQRSMFRTKIRSYLSLEEAEALRFDIACLTVAERFYARLHSAGLSYRSARKAWSAAIDQVNAMNRLFPSGGRDSLLSRYAAETAPSARRDPAMNSTPADSSD